MIPVPVKLTAAGAVLLLASCNASWRYVKRDPMFRPTPAEPVRVAVLPFEDKSGGNSVLYYPFLPFIYLASLVTFSIPDAPPDSVKGAETLRELLIARLGGSAIRVVSSRAVLTTLHHRGLLEGSPRMDPVELGKILGVDAVLYGELLDWAGHSYVVESRTVVEARVRLVSCLDRRELLTATIGVTDRAGITGGPTGYNRCRRDTGRGARHGTVLRPRTRVGRLDNEGSASHRECNERHGRDPRRSRPVRRGRRRCAAPQRRALSGGGTPRSRRARRAGLQGDVRRRRPSRLGSDGVDGAHGKAWSRGRSVSRLPRALLRERYGPRGRGCRPRDARVERRARHGRRERRARQDIDAIHGRRRRRKPSIGVAQRDERRRRSEEECRSREIDENGLRERDGALDAPAGTWEWGRSASTRRRAAMFGEVARGSWRRDPRGEVRRRPRSSGARSGPWTPSMGRPWQRLSRSRTRASAVRARGLQRRDSHS